jgi:hypothetical protein
VLGGDLGLLDLLDDGRSGGEADEDESDDLVQHD